MDNVKGLPCRGATQGQEWYIPWFSVTANKLHTDLIQDDLNLGMSQVLITVVDCYDTSVLGHSPSTRHFDDYQTTPGIAHSVGVVNGGMNFIMSSSLTVGGVTVVTRNGRPQNQWQTTASYIQNSNDGAPGEHKEGRVWTYEHHKLFPPTSAFDFEDEGPSVVFAPNPSSRLPRVEVEVVTHWDSSITLSEMFALLRDVTKKPRPPAVRNFLNHVSVGVDLAKVG